MPTNVDIPGMGDSVQEAVLIKWHKADGERVAMDEPLCELETDKANVDLPSPGAGVLRHVKPEGSTVHVGETVARVDEAGAATPTPTPTPPSPAPAARPTDDLSPAVTRLVAENNLDPAVIPGTGKDGRLTKEDVVNYMQSAPAPAASPDPVPVAATKPAPPAEAKPAARSESTPATSKAPPAPAPTLTFDPDGTRRTPMSKMRVSIAKRLVEAQHTAAILTTFNEVDLSDIMALRAKYKDTFEKAHGVGLGFMSFFARAVTLGLREYPRVNASLDGADIVYHNYVHLGIAVSTDRGLAVPILRDVQEMGFAKIENEIKRLAGAARDGKLGLAEMSGGTFTITNGGVFGSLLSTPILTPPQSGILGMHTIQKRPVAVGPKLDQIEIRPMMYLALSYDHRLVDGKESVSFLVRVKQLLEDPARLMLEV